MTTVLLILFFSKITGGSVDAHFEAALHAARDNSSIEFRLDLDCVHGPVKRQLTVYNNSVAVWGRTRQLTITADDRQALLDTLITAGFAAMPERFGIADRPVAAKAPLRLSCRLEVSADGAVKKTAQVLYGEQSEQFMEMTAALLDHIQPGPDEGQTVANMTQALAGLADGTLAPEVLKIRFVRLPSDDDITSDARGSIINIGGGKVSRQTYLPGNGSSAPVDEKLSASDLAGLVEVLIEADLGSMPINIQSNAPTELEVDILGQRKTIVGRPGFRAQPVSVRAAFEKISMRLLQ